MGAFFGQVKLRDPNTVGFDWQSYNSASKDFESGLREVKRAITAITGNPHNEMWEHGFWCQAGRFTEMLMNCPDIEQSHGIIAQLLLERGEVNEAEVQSALASKVDQEFYHESILQFVDGFLEQMLLNLETDSNHTADGT